MHILIILGLVQGVTEFLPISSSGHLLILEKFFDLDSTLFLGVFLHLATFLAIVVYYFKDILKIFREFFSNFTYTKKLIIGSLPAIFFGYFLNNFFENVRSVLVVAVMLFAVSIYMYVAQKKQKKEKHLTNFGALLVGLSQVLALIPGSSRSGITIATAYLLGEENKEAIKFSFLIALPATFGAFVLELSKLPDPTVFIDLSYITVFVITFITGLISIRFLVDVLKRFGFTPFVFYRIILSLVLIFLLFTHVI